MIILRSFFPSWNSFKAIDLKSVYFGIIEATIFIKQFFLQTNEWLSDEPQAPKSDSRPTLTPFKDHQV